MSLKTSFFNKTLVKSDFKRLWWIPALHTLAIFMMTVFRFMERYYNNPTPGAVAVKFVKEAEVIYTTIHDYMIPAFVLACIVPVILGVFLFSYLHTQKASTFSHSIPVSRLSAFVSHTVSGILMFLIPLAINGIVLLLMRTDAGFAQTFKVSHLFGCMGIASLYSFVAFALSVIISMITGNVLANFIFTYVFATLPIAVEMFMDFFAYTQLYGYVQDTDYWCVDHLYLSSEKLTTAGGITLYIIIGLVLLIAGYFVYRIRNIENHSSVVAFSALRPVFIFGAAICSGAIGFLYVNALWGFSNAFVMLPFGLIGLVIATMLVKKSFRGLKLLKPVIVYCLIIVSVYAVYHYDLTGFETRVPDSDDIEYVTFDQNGINDYSGIYYSLDGKKYTYDDNYSPDLTGKDAKSVIALHQYLTGEEKVTENFKNPWSLTLSYKLKNGNVLKRRYTIDYDEYKALLEPVVTSDTIRKTYFPVLRDSKRSYIRIEVRDGRVSDDYLAAFSDEETINTFIEALKKDTQNATYDEYAARNRTYTTVEVCYKESATYEDGGKVPYDDLMERTETYYIRPSYINTLALINERNLLWAVPKAEDITKIGVEYYGYGSEMMSYKEIQDIDGWSFHYIVEDSEEIAQIYEYCQYGGTSRISDMTLVFFKKDGRHFVCDLNSEESDLPKILKPDMVTYK